MSYLWITVPLYLYGTPSSPTPRPPSMRERKFAHAVGTKSRRSSKYLQMNCCYRMNINEEMTYNLPSKVGLLCFPDNNKRPPPAIISIKTTGFSSRAVMNYITKLELSILSYTPFIPFLFHCHRFSRVARRSVGAVTVDRFIFSFTH